MNRCQAVETLLEDVIDQIAAFNPDVVGAWRDQAAVNWQRIIDRDCPPNEVINEALYRTRFEILEAVMDRAGQPYEAAEVVDLADARAQAAVRRGSRVDNVSCANAAIVVAADPRALHDG